jgi:hypothetical protein
MPHHQPHFSLVNHPEYHHSFLRLHYDLNTQLAKRLSSEECLVECRRESSCDIDCQNTEPISSRLLPTSGVPDRTRSPPRPYIIVMAITMASQYRSRQSTSQREETRGQSSQTSRSSSQSVWTSLMRWSPRTRQRERRVKVWMVGNVQAKDGWLGRYVKDVDGAISAYGGLVRVVRGLVSNSQFTCTLLTYSV